MQIEIKDLIGYGFSFATVLGGYFILRNKQQNTEVKIIELEDKMNKINQTHMNLTNSVVRLTESQENFKSESHNHWQKTENGLDKIFDKFAQLDQNISQFWKDYGDKLKKD